MRNLPARTIEWYSNDVSDGRETLMGRKPDLTGQFITAAFDGTAGFPQMEDGSLFKAEPTTEGGQMRVVGDALRYGIVGWFWGGAVRIAAGAATEAGVKKRNSRNRDVLGLAFHDSSRPLARQANNTLDMLYDEDKVRYEMRLNPQSAVGREMFEMLQRGDVTASSIGFVIVSGDWVEAVDNGLDADPDKAGEQIDVFEAEQIDIVEVSLVAQGAFGGATSRPVAGAAEGRRLEPVGRVAADIVAGEEAEVVGAEETQDFKVRGAMPVSAIVGDDDGTDQDATADEGAPVDFAEGDTGDVSGGSGEVDGGAAPDGDGTAVAAYTGEELAEWAAEQKQLMRERRIDLIDKEVVG